MDTIDRSESSNLPSPIRPAQTPLLTLPPVFASELATSPTPQVNSRTLLRGLTRHWWQILVIWAVVSAPAVYLIHLFVKPTFEAFSTLSVTPGKAQLYESKSEAVDFRSVTPYLQTQVSLINSDRVLGPAVANPEVVNLSTIKESDEPRADLRKNMSVDIVKDAYVIRVALELTDGHQAAAIVNAVVQSYLAYHGEAHRSTSSTLRASLNRRVETLKSEIAEKQAEIKRLVHKGNTPPPVNLQQSVSQSGRDGSQPIFRSVSEEQRARLAQEMMKPSLRSSRSSRT